MKRVLVVDDNHEILNVIEIILQGEGYDVLCVDTGEDLKQKVLLAQPNLILLDIMLGAYNGLELCRELKNDPQTLQVPIVMISASHNIDKTSCEAEGFIAKPFEIDYLINKVAVHVN
ncbi:response regulator [Daejeonella sp.]|uniref:response regulator n=1 Tax=Daejeonella sp. TaxID=2805397 RepID=UPI0030C62E4E